MPVPECIQRLKADIRDARDKALPREIESLAGIRRPFKFRVRRFNDAEEDAKIARYMMKYAPKMSDRYREVFANMRRQLRDRQGEEQETTIQAIGPWRCGDCWSARRVFHGAWDQYQATLARSSTLT